MRKLLVLAGISCALFAPGVYADITFDGTVTVHQSSEQFGNGGAFASTTYQIQGPYTVVGSLDSLGRGNVLSAHSPNLGSFDSFCIEYNEPVSFSGTYYYQINTGAVADTGDRGSGANHIYGHIDASDTRSGPGYGMNMDNISIGTAWLYSQYRARTLQGYTYGTSASGGALQDAIWYLEGEISYAQLISGYDPSHQDGYNVISLHNLATLSTNFVHEAVVGTQSSYLLGVDPGTLTLAQGLSTDSVFRDSQGAYGVVVLNLYNSYRDSLSQDELAIVVPEPATVLAGALLLLPLGASTLRVLRRNRR